MSQYYPCKGLKYDNFIGMRWPAVIFLFLIRISLNAQGLYPSITDIETSINKRTINAKSHSSLVQINEPNAEIALKIDIASIVTGNDTWDSLLKGPPNAFILLRGNFPVKNLSFVDNANEEQREFTGKAKLTINGITTEKVYTCVLYNLNGNAAFTQNDLSYPLNINLYFEFEPEEFDLQKLYMPLTNGIKVQVSKGIINKLSANSPSLFK